MSYVMRTMKRIACNHILKSRKLYLDLYNSYLHVVYSILSITWYIPFDDSSVHAVTEDIVMASGKCIKKRCKSLLLHFDCVTNDT